MKIRKIEDDLKTEFYKLANDENEEPSVGKVRAPNVKSKEYSEESILDKKKDEQKKKLQEDIRQEGLRITRLHEQERII